MTSDTAQSLRLDARLAPRVERLIADTDRLFELTRALGSPLNITLPDQIVENFDEFVEVFRRHSLDGRVLFAHKANQSDSLIRALVNTRAGVDVASLGELQHTLAAGVHAGRIVSGGPKNAEYLWLAATSGTCVAVDSISELRSLVDLVRHHGLPRVAVTVRMSGFSSVSGVRSSSRPSRFGVDITDAAAVLDMLVSASDSVDFEGIAFHLDTISVREKALAVEACISVMNAARNVGLDPKRLNVGGGYRTCYLRDREQWERYTTALKEAAVGEREPLGWNDAMFGLRNEKGVLRGSLNVYEHYDEVTGAAYLDALLKHPVAGGHTTVGDLSLDHMFAIDVEPGRALLDNCGVTVARVAEVGRRNGARVVRLDMNRRDVSNEDSELFVDPFHVGRADRVPTDEGLFFTGNLCLEADFVIRRKVFLGTVPHVDDLMVFPNTAGYLSDFSATNAIRQARARRVAVLRDGSWCLDSQYWPALEAAP